MGQSLHIAEPFSNPVACLPLRFHFFFWKLSSWLGYSCSTHSAAVGLQAVSAALHTQPRPLALAHTSQLGYRAQPSAWTRARDRGLPTRAPSWKHREAFTETLSNITGILGT